MTSMISLNSAGGITRPDGLLGEFRMISFVLDRKSTRLNSSHSQISYAVFCLKKKKEKERMNEYEKPELRTRKCNRVPLNERLPPNEPGPSPVLYAKFETCIVNAEDIHGMSG